MDRARTIELLVVSASLVGAALALTGCSESTQDNFDAEVPPATCEEAADAAACPGARSYTCTGAVAPDDTDRNLVCASGVTAGDARDGGAGGDAGDGDATSGATRYCCLAYAQGFTECRSDRAGAGCEAGAYGFACTGPVSPGEVDPALTCRSGAQSADAALYCCTVR